MLLKLIQHDQDILNDTFSNPEVRRVLEKMLFQIVAETERNVLKLILTETNSQELFLKKARAEGARSFAVAAVQRLNSLTRRRDEASK